MIIDGREYAFRAFVKNGNGWRLTNEYFFNQAEALRFNEGYEVVWPVIQKLDMGEMCCIPNESDFELIV